MTVGQVLLARAQDVPDPVQRVVSSSSVACGVLLHAAADVVDDLVKLGNDMVTEVRPARPARAAGAGARPVIRSGRTGTGC